MFLEFFCSLLYLFLVLLCAYGLPHLQERKKTNKQSISQRSMSENDLSLEEFSERPWVDFSPQQKALTLQEQAQKIYSCQIGINYILSKKKLKGCINDALNFKALLQANGVPSSHILYFSDFTSPRPTKRFLLGAISQMLKEAPNGSTLLLSFSGHGTRTGFGFGNQTWCTLGEKDTSIDFILDSELFNVITPLMTAKPQSRLTVISDSCFSENMANLCYTYSPNKDNSQVITQMNEKYKTISATIFVISASTDSQTAADFEVQKNISHGALTFTLLKFLQTHRTQPFSYRQFILGINRLLTDMHFAQISCFSSSVALQLDEEFLFL